VKYTENAPDRMPQIYSPDLSQLLKWSTFYGL